MWTLLGFITLYFSDRDTWTRDTWSEKPVLGVVSCHQLSAVQSMETSCYHAVLMQLLQQLCSDLQHHDNTLQHTHLHRNEYNRVLRRLLQFFSNLNDYCLVKEGDELVKCPGDSLTGAALLRPATLELLVTGHHVPALLCTLPDY